MSDQEAASEDSRADSSLSDSSWERSRLDRAEAAPARGGEERHLLRFPEAGARAARHGGAVSSAHAERGSFSLEARRRAMDDGALVRIFMARTEGVGPGRLPLDFTRAVTDHLGEGVCAIDVAGRVTFLNPAAESLLGWSEAELLGRDMHDLVHAAGRRAPCRPGRDCPLRAGPLVRGALDCDDDTFTRKDGATFPVAYSLTPITLAGRRTGAVIAFRDIAPRKRAEAEYARLLEQEHAARAEAECAQRSLAFLAEAGLQLSESLDEEAVLDTLLRLATPNTQGWCVVSLTRPEGCQARIFRAADERLSGYLRALDAAYPAARAVFGEEMVARSHKPERMEDLPDAPLRAWALDAVHLRHLRALHPASYVSVPLLARGQLLGILTVVSTSRKRRYGVADQTLMEELARRAAIALDNARLFQVTRQTLEQRDTFLSIASHELRTPLTSMKMQAQLLHRKLRKLEMAEAQQVDRIGQGIERIVTLVDHLLDVSQIRAGELPLHLTACDVAALCRAAAQDESNATGRAVICDAPPDPLPVRADAHRIEQVLVNLISNAVKFSPEDTPVTLSARRAGDEVVVSVSDFGPGIPPEARPHLFQQFYRVPGTEVQFSSHLGLGLGLYLSREILARHGGRIWVEDTGSGCTMSFALPLAPEAGGATNG